jgi:hypothetical protein
VARRCSARNAYFAAIRQTIQCDARVVQGLAPAEYRAATLAAGVLTDSAAEHYRAGFHTRAMFIAPVVSAAAVVTAVTASPTRHGGVPGALFASSPKKRNQLRIPFKSKRPALCLCDVEAARAPKPALQLI